MISDAASVFFDANALFEPDPDHSEEEDDILCLDTRYEPMYSWLYTCFAAREFVF
jgi:hypothetical protein